MQWDYKSIFQSKLREWFWFSISKNNLSYQMCNALNLCSNLHKLLLFQLGKCIVDERYYKLINCNPNPWGKPRTIMLKTGKVLQEFAFLPDSGYRPRKGNAESALNSTDRCYGLRMTNKLQLSMHHISRDLGVQPFFIPVLSMQFALSTYSFICL